MGRALPAVLLAVCLVGTGCGGGSDDGGPSAHGSSAAGSTVGAADPADADLCSVVTADQVGQVLHEKVTLTKDIVSGCRFEPAGDVREISGSMAVTAIASGGAFDGVRTGIEATMTNPTTVDVPGIGDQAFVTTGTTGGDNVHASGAALLGDDFLQVTLIQGAGHTQQEMATDAKALLTLVSSALGH